MNRLWLDILISFLLCLLAWACWELAIILKLASHLKAVFWELGGYYMLTLLDTKPTTLNLLGLSLLTTTLVILFLLFKSLRGLFDRLLLAGRRYQ